VSDTEQTLVGQRTVGPASRPAPVPAAPRVGRLVGAVVLLVVGPLVYTLTAADAPRVIELHPSNADAGCKEEFVAVARSLQPGDELVLHGGTYSQSCQRRIRGIHGTVDRPIIIRAAAGETPVLTRPRRSSGEYSQNNLEIEGSSHLIIRGLKLKGGSTGLRFMGTTAHITLEDSEIYETDNNAVSMNSGDTDSFVIRRNHIHHTGLLPDALGETEGEGLYVGCHDGRCVGSNHLIENNYIHHLRGTSDGGNDGIEIKRGSHGVVIRNNVIHHTNIGTRYPCIFVYGAGPQPNIVEGNALWQCGEAIQVVADAIVRNNVIADSDVGITSAPQRQVPRMQRVSIVNNTLYGHQECLYLRWQHARDMVLANNAAYCPGERAVDALGLEEPGVRVRANLVEGGLVGVALDGVRFLPGGRAQEVFREPRAADFFPRPGAPLIGSAVADWAPEADFNGRKRGKPYDVGAYQSGGHATNPGWRIAPGFKDR
jgi:hypothetical protein